MDIRTCTSALLGMMLAAAAWSATGQATEGKSVRLTVFLDDVERDREGPLLLTEAAAAGDTLEICLEQQAVGKVWELKEHDPKQFEALGKPERVRDPKVPEGKPGIKEGKLYRFRILAPGKLAFEWRRPFGKPDAKMTVVSIQQK